MLIIISGILSLLVMLISPDLLFISDLFKKSKNK